MMEENEREKPQRWTVWLKIPVFILLTAVIGLALLLAMTGTPLTSMTTTDWNSLVQKTVAGFEEQAPLSLDLHAFGTNTVHAIETVGENVVYATISEVRCLDSEGTQLWTLPISVRAPWLDVRGHDVLVADIGGRYIGLVRDGQVVWEKNLEEDIVNARISRDYILLVTNSAKDGYNMNLQALSTQGTEVSFRVVSEYYPFLAINDPVFEQSLFVVTGFSADALKTTAVVELMTPKWEQKASLSGEDELFSGAFATDESHLVLVGEKRLVCLDQKLVTAWTHQPEGMRIAAAAKMGGGRLMTADFDQAAFDRQRTETTTCTVLNADGTVRDGTTIDGRVRMLAANEDLACAATDTQLAFLDGDAQLIKTQSVRGTVSDVRITEDGIAYVVANDTLTMIRPLPEKRFLGLF